MNKYTRFLAVLLIIGSVDVALGQTVSNVSPLRVTTGSIVTITGTGFNSTPSVSVSGISISNVSRQDTETVTFKINRTNTTNNSDPFASNPGSDVFNGVVTVAGNATTFQIDYIAPTNRDHSVESSATNPVDRITEIYTNMDGFSRFSSRNDVVDDKHELLGFKYESVVYSTGVNDALLEQSLGSEIVDAMGDPLPGVYVRQSFKAYSTNGVEGTTNDAHYLAAADTMDGLIGSPESNGTSASNFPEIEGFTIYATLIDGVNGLELGTGITNLNQNNTVRFFSGNGQVGALNEIPDLLITQIAQAGAEDIYYYADIEGNVIGRPIRLFIEENQTRNPPLATNNWDFYRYQTGLSFDIALPATKQLGDNATRPLRMLGFKLEEFAIDAGNIGNINNINMSAGGKADLAFMAYNRAAFEIRSPLITQSPPSRFICELPSTDIVTFEAIATIDGEENNPGFEPVGDEVLEYQWYKFNSELTGEDENSYQLNGVTSSDLGTYNVIISNEFGAILIPVKLDEGGTPAFWNGSTWDLPPGFGNGPGEIQVLNEERSLRFSDDYNEAGLLEGCDCFVNAGRTVTIPSGSSVKLFGKIEVEDAIPDSTDEDGNFIEGSPQGVFYLEDGSSLVQINDVTVNQNTGDIEMQRLATSLNSFDYIYWSTPVAGFSLNQILNDRSFYWDVNFLNSNGTDGNWQFYNGVMDNGRGYIARVPNGISSLDPVFKGVPNNGIIKQTVYKSSGSQGVGRKHWNLIGNPYPSAISASRFLDESENDFLEGAVYIWDQTIAFDNTTANPSDSPFYQGFIYNYVDNYVTFNKTGGVPAGYNGNIAAGQGFFVKLNDALPTPTDEVVFNNAMRFGAGESILDNSGFFRTSNFNNQEQLEKQLIWISLVNEDQESSATLIGYVSGATNNKDRLYDAFANRGSRELSVYTMVEESKMAIQGRAAPFSELDEVPLGIQIPETGIYSIGIDHIEGSVLLSEQTEVFIEDTFTGLIYNLKEEPFSFQVEAGTYNDRFILRYTADQLSTKDVETSDTFAYIKYDRLHVQSNKVITRIQVYDISGKLVLNYEPQSNDIAVETDFNYARGAYIVLIELEDSITVSKKLLN